MDVSKADGIFNPIRFIRIGSVSIGKLYLITGEMAYNSADSAEAHMKERLTTLFFGHRIFGIHSTRLAME